MTWHLITCEYPPDVGGISDHTAQLARGLAGAGDEVHVYCPGGERAAPAGVRVHAVLGAFAAADLRRADEAIDACPGPRRLVVQWVPHGFGRRSLNLGFCLWLARRARRGDELDIVVHEPYLEFGWGPLRHVAMALVHRVMTAVLLRAAHRVWLSTPAWESLLRPYALGRAMDMRWLPVPGCESASGGDAEDVKPIASTLGRPLIGHFGTYGDAVATLLEDRVWAVMDGPCRPTLLLLGSGGESFATRLLARHPQWHGRVHATGFLSTDRLNTHLAACDVLLQPYPDGITVRRTSVMAALARGRAVVTTSGHLTEPLWAQQGAVALVDVNDAVSFTCEVERLLCDVPARRIMEGRARAVYDAHFSVDRLIHTLRAA
jgi:glycosyltransferase involved in cell wall biosynthesis